MHKNKRLLESAEPEIRESSLIWRGLITETEYRYDFEKNTLSLIGRGLGHLHPFNYFDYGRYLPSVREVLEEIRGLERKARDTILYDQRAEMLLTMQ